MLHEKVLRLVVREHIRGRLRKLGVVEETEPWVNTFVPANQALVEVLAEATRLAYRLTRAPNQGKPLAILARAIHFGLRVHLPLAED